MRLHIPALGVMLALTLLAPAAFATHEVRAFSEDSPIINPVNPLTAELLRSAGTQGVQVGTVTVGKERQQVRVVCFAVRDDVACGGYTVRGDRVRGVRTVGSKANHLHLDAGDGVSVRVALGALGAAKVQPTLELPSRTAPTP